MRTVKSLLLGTILGMWAFSAHADMSWDTTPVPAPTILVWSWQIDNPTQTVLPTDTIVFTGTIFNDPNSAGSIIGPNSGNVAASNIFLFSATGDFTVDKYTFDDGPLGSMSFSDQFTDVTIAPGQSFSFTLYTLIPVSGGVAPGTYSAPFNNLTIDFPQSGGGVQVAIVPEPESYALMLFALVFVGFAAKRRT